MGKATKRQRKFNATGGVKARLEKGSITNKGKLKKRKKTSSKTDHDPPPKKVATDHETPTLDRSDDFVGQQNLGDLDIESFFDKITHSLENEQEKEEPEVSDSEEEVKSKESADEESSSDEEEHGLKGKKLKRTIEDDDSASESSDVDSDDEDVEAAEARMKAQMAKMQSEDPEFHSFLKENEESLLEFGEDGDEDDAIENEIRGDEEEQASVEKTGKSEQCAIHLTPKVLKSLEQGTFKSHGIKSLKKLIGAYRSACHLTDSSTDGEGKKNPGESGTSYIIDSSKVFDQLMVMCLNRCHEEFRYHLLGEKSSNGPGEGEEEAKDTEEVGEEIKKPLDPKKLESSSKWPDIRSILLSFHRSTLHVITETKEPELLTFILKALSKYIPLMTPFPRVAEAMLKTLTSLWSAPLDSSEDYQIVRLNAFFRIRQLALTQPFPFVEECLKKTYLAYAKRAKFGSGSSVSTALPTLTFMGNCIVELYSLDYHSSYQHAFVYIRQLALLLRAAMQKKTAESFQQVFCWQYIHCLKLWVAILANASPEEDAALMRSLIYPLTEIILGTCRLAPSRVRHLPMRYHCIRLLQQLAAANESFIPTTSLLLDCLDWKEWSMPPKKSKSGSARGIQMNLILKLPKDDALRTHEQLEAGMNEFFVLLQREVELYRYAAGFPEFSVRIIQRLRKFAKETRNPRWRTFCRATIETCERYSAAAVSARSKLQEAPKDVNRLECLRPHEAPTMLERHEASIQKETKLAEANRPTTPSKEGKKEENGAEVDEEEEQPSKKKRKKSKKKRKKQDESKEVVSALNEEVLDQEDEVQEGIDWSDDD